MTHNDIMEEFRKIVGPLPRVLEYFKDMTCPICGQPIDKSLQVKKMEQFISDKLKQAMESVVPKEEYWTVVEYETALRSNIDKFFEEVKCSQS